MIRNSLFLLLLLFVSKSYGQVNGEVFVLDRDVFYCHYTPSIVEDNLFNYQKASLRLSIPPVKFKKLALYNTVGIDYHQFSYKKEASALSDDLNNFYNINYSLLMQYQLTTKWKMNLLALPHILSSLTGSLESKDVRINGILFAERTFKNNTPNRVYKLSFGVAYLTLSGKTTINPVLNFMAQVNDKFSFVLGLPNTYVKYNFNKKHSLKLLADLNDFSAHVNSSVYLDENKTTKVDKAVFTTISTGLEYNYWVTNNWGILVRTLHGVYENYQLENSSGNTVYDFDSTLKPYATIGIKFNPLR